MIPLTITDVRAVPGDSAFLLDDGKTAILYDTGFGFTGNAIAEKLRAILGSRSLDYIFLTHSHYDHALGSAYIARAFPGVKIVAGAYAAKIFSKPSARALMRDMDRKAAKFYGAADYEDRIDELRVDITVEDGDTLTCGSMEFTVIALPGHTRCSVGFYLPENGLLLGSETLGVYFGKDTFLPSYLVGYQMALDSFRKAGRLEIRSILLPHYGIVEGPEAASYLENAEQVSREAAQTIRALLLAGKPREDIIAQLERDSYSDTVAPTYPIDAFRLNTGIMIDLIRREFAVPAPQDNGTVKGSEQMEHHELVCYCDHVTKGEIIAAMEQGARTLSDIKRMTGACTSCKCEEMNPSGKCCGRDIALVMKEYWEANPDKAPKNEPL